MPLVSVVIPTFNCAEYIGRTLDSIFNQSLQDFEVIIVDDGSGDDTKAAIDHYLRDVRVRYIYQTNRGASGARNTGARLSNANYIHFVDADDTLAAEALSVLSAALDAEPRASWCISDLVRINDRTREVYRPKIPKDDTFYGILKEDFINIGNFFRRTAFVAVGMYDEDLKTREDWDLNIRMIQKGMTFIYVAKPLYYYYARKGSLMTEAALILECTERVLQKYHKPIADAGDARAAKIYSENMWHLARGYFYSAGRIERTAFCVSESLAYDLDRGRAVQEKVLQSVRHRFVKAPIHTEHVRLLSCEFEIRTNSQDVIDHLSTFTPHAEQDMPIFHRIAVTISWSVTWTGDEFRISGDEAEDGFEFTAADAVKTLYRRLHSRAIVAFPDHILISAAIGLHRGRSFLMIGAEPAGKTALALSLMLEGVEITGDALALLRGGEAFAFPKKFHAPEHCIGQASRLRAIDRFAACVSNPRENQIIVLDPLEFGKRWRIAPAPVSTILFLEPDFGGKPALRRTGKVEIVQRVMPHCAPPLSGRRNWLEDLCATINGAESFVVQVGDVDSAVAAALEALG